MSDMYEDLFEKIIKLESENARLQAELKFADHRMLCLAEALADTRAGYQKKIDILMDRLTDMRRDQKAGQKDNQGKSSRPGRKGKGLGSDHRAR